MYDMPIDSPYIPRALGDQAMPRQGAVRSISTRTALSCWLREQRLRQVGLAKKLE